MQTFENFLVESKAEYIITVIPMMKSNNQLIDTGLVKSFKNEKDAEKYHEKHGGYIVSNPVL